MNPGLVMKVGLSSLIRRFREERLSFPIRETRAEKVISVVWSQ